MTENIYIILGVVGVLVIGLIFIYNKLVTLRNRTNEAWSDIDVQLKRRYDLIPNLIETVKGYAKQEQEVFMKVTEARANALGAGSVQEKAQAENMLSGALKSLFAVSESYPDLKSSQNFLNLQNELTDTENKIQASRRFYNSNVRNLNTVCEQFPTNIFAGMLKVEKREFFELTEEAAKEPVSVSF